MPSKYVTREEFELYGSIQEKREHLSELRGSLKDRYFYRGLSAVNTILGASIVAFSTSSSAAFAIYSDNPIYFVPFIVTGAFGGAAAVIGITGLNYNVGRVRDISYEIGKTEAELEQIKESPEYKAFYATE